MERHAGHHTLDNTAMIRNFASQWNMSSLMAQPSSSTCIPMTGAGKSAGSPPQTQTIDLDDWWNLCLSEAGRLLRAGGANLFWAKFITTREGGSHE
jgi:hypothetical protein